SFILVRSNTTKNRQAGKIYLKSRLAEMLKAIKPATVAADELVFAGRIAVMSKMHRHLQAAEIPVYDGQGRKVDFHALRMTYNMNLEGVGASLQVRQELLRHSDPRLTAGTYMDGTRLETASLIEKLPDFLDGKDTDTQQGTQTTGASCPDVAQAVTLDAGAGTSEHAADIEESHGLAECGAVCHTSQPEGSVGFESPSLRHF